MIKKIMRIKFNFYNVLIIVGILLNITAALITTLLVNDNNDLMNDLRQKVMQREQVMNDLWQSVGFQEQSVNTLVVLKSMEIDPDSYRPLSSHIINGLFGSQDKKFEEYSTAELVAAMQQNKIVIGDRIDELYIDKKRLSIEIARLQKRENIYFNIAVFIQILGLIFILSKEIFRHSAR